MAVGATCAFAANPFVDVPVRTAGLINPSELADAGIIRQYDGQYFGNLVTSLVTTAAGNGRQSYGSMDKASVEWRARLFNKLPLTNMLTTNSITSAFA